MLSPINGSIVSTPTVVCMSTQRAWALMRAEARGPSATLIAATSCSLHMDARSRVGPGSAPRGGSSSTETTNCFPILRARAVFSSRGMGTGASLGRLGARTSTASRSGWRIFTDRTRFLMCSGVVPQQPPTTDTPAAMKRRA